MIEPPAFPRRWQVHGAELVVETFSSRIWKVVCGSGSPAIVKALKPFDDVGDELRGAHFLKWRDGEGSVRLLGRDGRKMLLEYGGERSLTAVLDTDGDDAATQIAAGVLQRLHHPSARPVPTQLQPLRERFSALFKRAGKQGGGLYREAGSLAASLLDTTRAALPLHGDLHHDNIVCGTRGWLSIDPKGLLGDPCFDAANLFYNPLDRDALCTDPQRIAGMAQSLSAAQNLDPRRVLDFALAYGCLSAAWHGEDGNAVDEQRELTIAEVVKSVRLSF